MPASASPSAPASRRTLASVIRAAPWATLLVAALALGVAAWRGPFAETQLVYERAAVLQGEWWRLWTGHLVHFGASHLFWNLAVLVPAGAWAERLSPARTRGLLLFAPGLIGAALVVLDPTLVRYAGLSGLAAALLAWLAITQLAAGTADRWFWRSVLALLAAKIGLELLAERPAFARFSVPGVHAVPIAHVAGVACAVALYFRTRPRRSHIGR